MELTTDDILDRVSSVENERSDFRSAVKEWRAAYKLQGVYKTTPEEALRKNKVEQVTLPTPYNVVNMAMRLLANEPKHIVPPRDVEDKEDDRSDKVEKWLHSAYRQNDLTYKGRLLQDVAKHCFVDGTFAIETKWIGDALPKARRDRSFPFLIRSLDPLNVGIRHGSLYTEYVYHTYCARRREIEQRYPDLKDMRRNKGKTWKGKFDTDDDVEMDVVDFWWVDPKEGTVWNAVLADEDFVLEPWETSYPDVPITVGYGDTLPFDDETVRGLSILFPIIDSWKFQCRTASQLGTGQLNMMFPPLFAQNEMGGGVMPEVTIQPTEPLALHYLQPGWKIFPMPTNPNLNIAQALNSQVEAGMQQATFPGVMYGQAPGDLQAGYGVNLLADAAKGRVNEARVNLEDAFAQVNRILLGLVEELGDDEGVTVWSFNEKNGRPESITLTAEDVDGYYENSVQLSPSVPQDLAQKKTLMLREVEAGIRSRRSYREQVGDPFPDDEDVRIAVEQMVMSEEMTPFRHLRSLQQYWPNDWEGMIAGTPLQGVWDAQQKAIQELEDRKAIEALIEENGPPPQGFHYMPDGTLMPDQQMQPPMPGPMPGPMGPPPGPVPPMGPGGPPPGPGPIQPPAMAPGVMPPEMQGQMTPELLGMNPDSPETQLLFQQMTGAPLSPEEELQAIEGRLKRG